MIGSRMPIAKTSLGKAIMAYAPEDELKKFIDSLTAWEARKVKSELLVIRRNGYATDREENEPGVACVGAPVFNSAGHAVAAMSVSGPSVRMLKQEREVGSTLVSTCIEMSRRIGFSSQPVTALAARRVQS
jgi:DNA-binding IclR family transcriptional regulator